jgi:hypothetical protein
LKLFFFSLLSLSLFTCICLQQLNNFCKIKLPLAFYIYLSRNIRVRSPSVSCTNSESFLRCPPNCKVSSPSFNYQIVTCHNSNMYLLFIHNRNMYLLFIHNCNICISSLFCIDISGKSIFSPHPHPHPYLVSPYLTSAFCESLEPTQSCKLITSTHPLYSWYRNNHHSI